jgi:hypothetical protein
VTEESDAQRPESRSDLSLVVIQLLKGPLCLDTHERLWSSLLTLRAQVADYVGTLGLTVVVDEAEGFAFLRSRPDDEDGPEVPRLIARHPLSLHRSILVALLRKRLAEFDASNADARLVMSRDQIVEMMRLFVPESSNEAKLVDDIGRHIGHVVELGFLRRLKGPEEVYEIRRIIKAFVDGQWLAGLDARLGEYLAELTGEPAISAPNLDETAPLSVGPSAHQRPPGVD